MVLIDPFPPQQQKIVSPNPAPLQGGNVGHIHHEDCSSSTIVFVCNQVITLVNRAKTHETPLEKNTNGIGGSTDKPSSSTTPPTFDPLQIEKTIFDSVFSST